MDAACVHSVRGFRQRQAQSIKKFRFAKVFGAPVHPGSERIAPGHECRPGRRANRLHVKLFQQKPIFDKSVQVRREPRITSIETRMRPTHVVG